MMVPNLGSVLRSVFQALGVLVLVCSNVWAGSAHPNLVAWYRMEGNALDSSGAGLHGTPVGSPTVVPGRIGRGYALNGTSQRINITGVTHAGNSHTFACWINSAQTAPGYLADFASGRLIFAYNINIAGTTGRIGYYDASWRDIGESPRGAWRHVAFVLDAAAGIGRVYVDGVLLGSDTYTAVDLGGTAALGGHNSAPGEWLACNLDDVRIYNAALTPSDIRRVMHGKQPLHRY